MHQPVLLEPVLHHLLTCRQGVYIDATFGRGGHTQALLAQLGPEARVIAFDQDPEAIAFGKTWQDQRLTLIQDNFAHIPKHLEALGLSEQVTGMLIDLGVSSPQLDQAERGFSFSHDGPLDMRMDPTKGISVASWLQTAAQADIADVLWRYGEEKGSRRIAQAIVQARSKEAVTGTKQLATIIASAVKGTNNKHPATRSFQALRIMINQELAVLTTCLNNLKAILAPGGRAAIISFHSLEDRLVKQYCQKLVTGPKLPRHLPVTDSQLPNKPSFEWIAKQVKASPSERQHNPRARSGVLRVVGKVVGPCKDHHLVHAR